MLHRLGGSPNLLYKLSMRKWQILTPREAKNPEPILMKLSMVDYVRDPTPHDDYDGVAQRGWSGQMCDLSHLLFFLFFLLSAFFSARPGHISWPIGTIYTPKCVFPAKDVPFRCLDNIRLHLGVKPPKTSPKWAGIGILQPNQQRVK